MGNFLKGQFLKARGKFEISCENWEARGKILGSSGGRSGKHDIDLRPKNNSKK